MKTTASIISQSDGISSGKKSAPVSVYTSLRIMETSIKSTRPAEEHQITTGSSCHWYTFKSIVIWNWNMVNTRKVGSG